MAHTPGPWQATFGEHAGYDCMTGAWTIRQVGQIPSIVTVDLGDYDYRSPEAEANAHLIAAAPDMLQALKETLDYWDTTGFSDCDADCDCIVQSVQRAIAKAKGQ